MQTQILDTAIKHMNVMGNLDETASEIIDHVGMYVHGKWVAYDTYHLSNDTTAFIIRVCEVKDDSSTNTNLTIDTSVWANMVEPIIVIISETDDVFETVANHAWKTYMDKCRSFAEGNF